MNRTETAELLRTRSALTSQPYGDAAVEAWHTALAHLDLEQARAALVKAARSSRTVSVAELLEQVPRRLPTEIRHDREPGCTCGFEGRICEMHKTRGYEWIARIRAEMAERRGARA